MPYMCIHTHTNLTLVVVSDYVCALPLFMKGSLHFTQLLFLIVPGVSISGDISASGGVDI